MIRIFTLVSIRELALKPVRTALVLLGIAAGVSMLTAITIVNRGILDQFERSILAVAGEVDLQVVAPGGENPISADIAAVVEGVPGVYAAIPAIDRSVPIVGEVDRLRLFAVDFAHPRVREAYGVRLRSDEDPVALLSQPDVVLVVNPERDDARTAVGASFAAVSAGRVTTLRVVGAVASQSPIATTGETFAVVDIGTADRLLALNGVVDRIDVFAAPGVAIDRLREAVQQNIPAGYEAVTPVGRGDYFERTVFAYQRTIEGFSLLAILAAIFIVYSTVSTAVLSRRKAFGTMRCAGATRSQVGRLLVLEALGLGLIASIVGALGGVPLAHAMLSSVATMMDTIFLTAVGGATLRLSVLEIVTAIAVGTAAAVLSAVYPAWLATRLDPVQSSADRHGWTEGQRVADVRFFLGCALLLTSIVAAAVVLEVRLKSILAGNVASVAWFLAFILLSVPTVAWLTTLLASRLERMFGVSGRIAAENLTRSAGTSSVAVSALAMSLATTVTLVAILHSFQLSLAEYILRFMGGSLMIASTHNQGGWLEAPLPASIRDQLAAAPGVRAVDTIRLSPGHRVGDMRVGILAVSGSFLTHERYGSWFLKGESEAAFARVRSGNGVLISEALHRLRDIDVGEHLELTTPAGSRSLPVEGVVVDYASDQGTIIMSAPTFAALWRDDRVNRFHVHLDPGLDPETARYGILQALGDPSQLKILKLQELVAYHDKFLSSAFGAARVLELLIVVVTLAGVAEALLTSVSRRRREFALARAAGASVGQIERAVVIEAGIMVVSGLALGLVGGVVSAWLWVRYHFTYLLGWILQFFFPWDATIRMMIIAAIVAIAAAYVPARRAARMPILEALRYE